MQRVPVMTCLKQIMLDKRLHLPRDRELENEMNGEISEQTKTGKTKFYHGSGTHDDRLWALALAVYAERHDIVHYHPDAAVGPKPTLRARAVEAGRQAMATPTRKRQPGRRTDRIETCYACNHAKLP